MELVFAYGAGLLTLINPCVLPVLPIVLAAALNADRYGPLALAAGMSLSFVVLRVLITTFGASVGLTQDRIAAAGALIMVGFGVVLLVPAFARRFERATSGMASGADSMMTNVSHTTLSGQFIGGMLLGAVWSPCIGPTLGGAIALAAQGSDLLYAAGIMVFFALGVSTLILSLGFGAREALRNRAQSLRGLAMRAKPILGVAFVTVGTALYFQINHVIEAWTLDVMPIWLQDLSVAL